MNDYSGGCLGGKGRMNGGGHLLSPFLRLFPQPQWAFVQNIARKLGITLSADVCLYAHNINPFPVYNVHAVMTHRF